MADPLHLSLCEVASALQERLISPVELTEAALQRAARDEPKLNAYVRLLEEPALAAARQAEQDIMAGRWRGPLHGVPVAVKDLYDMAGLPTTCSSEVRQDHVAKADATCVRRLQQAGAIIIGKTHTHEFAYGITTPTTGNPWDPACSPGGSSGGSGATVAARGCFMAMGTDTAGSIRIPAAVCGVVGLKPTYGRVSRAGVAPLSWSLDHAGPLTRTVADAAATLAAIAGHDAADPACANQPVPDYSAELEDGASGLRVGVPRDYFFSPCDTDVARNVHAAIQRLRDEGATLVEVDTPLAERIMPVEFGLLLPEATSWHHQMLRQRRERYQEDVRTFLELGAMIPATDYIAAQRWRRRIQTAWQALFDAQRLDAIIAPTVPTPAVRRDQPAVQWPDGSEEPVTNVFTRLAAPGNVTGLPAISVPCGFSSAGLPTAFQLIGRPFQEARILRLARAYERTVSWSDRLPPL